MLGFPEKMRLVGGENVHHGSDLDPAFVVGHIFKVMVEIRDLQMPQSFQQSGFDQFLLAFMQVNT